MPHDLPTGTAIMALAGTGSRIPYPSDTIRLLFSCLRCNTQHQTTIAMLPYERKAEVQCWACCAFEEIRISPHDNRIDVYVRWLRHQRRALARAEALANLRPGYFICDDCDQPHRNGDHPHARVEGAAGAGGAGGAGGRARDGPERTNAVAALEELERARRNTAAINTEEGEGEEEDAGEEDMDGQEYEEQENVPRELEEGYWPAVEDVYGI